ncbi:hypothetical protein ABC347_09370 [Sphingomonas sp. 1P06PA]|uniref:hypothetical protein n=1 Tax=Sphingomonas sp. 1P06PA TaxID=554121 RepID=UPI0039A70BFD
MRIGLIGLALAAVMLPGCERVPPETAEEAEALNDAANMLDTSPDDAALPARDIPEETNAI